MKICNFARLSQYVDGELTLPARLTLEEHLTECSTCRADVDRLRRVNRMLVTWGSQRDPLPSDTERRIFTSVDRKNASRHIAALNKMMPAAMGSGVAAILVLLSANLGLAGHSSPAAPVATTATSMRQIIKQQTAALQRERRSEAILGSSRASSTTTVRWRHTSVYLD
jgi:predicted anti-sigma-YlaC factor YlaD